MRPSRLLVVIALGVGLLGMPSATTPGVAAAPTAGCGHVFSRQFKAALHRGFPHQRVTASVVDTRTHCRYHVHHAMRITTASVIKAQVLGAVLLQAQDRHRQLTRWERSRIHPMIRYSLNNPYVADLYQDVGGVPGMDRFDRRMGATHTTNTLAYGATWTTANDRMAIALKMLHGGGPMHRAYRQVAWHYMTHVHPTQRWGITAGVPAGWAVALKNGFYPMNGYGWRVGSTGFVRSPGRHGGYAITVMTDHDPNQHTGIRLVEQVARRVAARLAGQPAGPRVVDRAVCVTTHSGESWQTVARGVHVRTSRWRQVRLVSGGNPSPLSGQRACSPDLRSAAASASGRRVETNQ